MNNKKRLSVRAWMLVSGIKQKHIAAATSLSIGVVNKTVNGKANNEKVLNFLKEKGCPEKLLNIDDGSKEKWFSAKELSALPGMPKTVQGVSYRARIKKYFARKRKGKGGGFEYHIINLPEETQRHINTHREVA